MRDVHNGRKTFYICPKPTATPTFRQKKVKNHYFELFREDGKFSSIYKGCTIFRLKVSVPATELFLIITTHGF